MLNYVPNVRLTIVLLMNELDGKRPRTSYLFKLRLCLNDEMRGLLPFNSFISKTMVKLTIFGTKLSIDSIPFDMSLPFSKVIKACTLVSL